MRGECSREALCVGEDLVQAVPRSRPRLRCKHGEGWAMQSNLMTRHHMSPLFSARSASWAREHLRTKKRGRIGILFRHPILEGCWQRTHQGPAKFMSLSLDNETPHECTRFGGPVLRGDTTHPQGMVCCDLAKHPRVLPQCPEEVDGVE